MLGAAAAAAAVSFYSETGLFLTAAPGGVQTGLSGSVSVGA